MLIAARNGFAVGGWKNPYITDGLVAMWDAEWNAGGGKHTSERILTNLVTGEIVSIPESGYTVGENYIISDADKGFTLGNIAGEISFPCTLTSLGCCMSKPTNTSSMSGYFSVAGIAGLAMWRRDNISISGVVLGYVYQSNDSRIHYYGAPANRGTAIAEADNETFGVLHARAMVAQTQTSSDGLVFYYDGNAKNGVDTMTYTDSWSSASYDVGSPKATSCQIKWCNVAVYSRALTADEIAANYAVDKARFGLP